MILEFLARSTILTVSVLISMASNETPHTTVSQHITTSSVNLLMFYAYFVFFVMMRYALLKVTGRDSDPNYDIPNTVHHCDDSKSVDLEDLEDYIENRLPKEAEETDKERMIKAERITKDITADYEKEPKTYGRENYFDNQNSNVIYVDPESEKEQRDDDVSSNISLTSEVKSMKSTAPEPKTLYNFKRPSKKQKLYIYSEMDELWETMRSVYGIGIVIFIASYASDLSSILPSIAFIISMLISALPDIYRMIQDVPENQTMHVPRLLSFFGYIMTCLGMGCFCITACLNDSLPDTFQFCHKTNTPRTDIILGLFLPLLSMVLVQQPNKKVNRNRVTLYKASPFAICIALCVITVTSKDNIFNIVDNAPDNLFFFFVVPFTKGLAVISIISACMYRKKVEVATILSFILFCKELHLHKPYKEVLQGLIGALICCSLSMIVLIMKHSKCIADMCAIIFDVNILD